MKRKGQAAIEYLVTYGWALAVIVVAVGVLSYFGLLNPERYIPSSCEFGEQLKCVDQYIESTTDGSEGLIVIRFRNNFEVPINITAATSNGKNIDFLGDDNLVGPDEFVAISNGEIKRVYFATSDEIFPGNKERFDITMTFSRVGGTVKHNISGEVFEEVSEKSIGLLS